MLTALTLFSGGGIADIGLKNANFKIVSAVERDETRCLRQIRLRIASVYAANHGDHIICNSVENVDYSQFAGVDLIHASPVCCGYSVARNSKLPPHPDNWVGLGVIKAAREVNPKWVTLENVPQYRKSDVYQHIRSALEEMGYWVSEKVVNCANYQVPQSRKRLIMIARRDYRFFDWGVEEKHQGWYEAIADLIPHCPVTKLANWQQAKLNRLKIIPEQALIPHVGCRNFTLTDASSPCPTIRALGHAPLRGSLRDRHWRQFDVADNFEVRMLTPRCAARLMTVPDFYQLPKQNWLAWRILGNGFPALAMQKIAQSLIKDNFAE